MEPMVERLAGATIQCGLLECKPTNTHGFLGLIHLHLGGLVIRS